MTKRKSTKGQTTIYKTYVWNYRSSNTQFGLRKGKMKSYHEVACLCLSDKGNNKITELRAILQRESQNS